MSERHSTDDSILAFADYFDGVSARAQRVGLRFEPELAPETLRLVLPDGGELRWRLDELRARPDQADKGSMALSPGHEALARLVVRDINALQKIKRTAPALNRRAKVGGKGRIAAWGGAAMASVGLIIFVLIPIMADQLANILPAEGEKALGDATFEQIRTALSQNEYAPIRICEAGPGVAAMEKMVARLNADADLPYPLRVHVLDHELVNAFALPGGRVVFFRGLIEAAEAPEEVAAVLAHETGHVALRHPTRGALRSAGSLGVLGLIFGDFAGGTVVLFLANQLINASYSQKAEAAADDHAHALMADAQLSPAALGTMFRRLMDKYGDAEGIMAHFSSHPKLVERIEAATAAAEGLELGDPILSRDEWRALRGICEISLSEAPEDEEPPEDERGELLERALDRRSEEAGQRAPEPDWQRVPTGQQEIPGKK